MLLAAVLYLIWSPDGEEGAPEGRDEGPYRITVQLQTPDGESLLGSSRAGRLNLGSVLEMQAFGTAGPPGESVSTAGGSASTSARPVDVTVSGSNINLSGFASSGEHGITWTLDAHGEGPRYVGVALRGRTLVYEKVPPRVRDVLLVIEPATLALHFGGVTMTVLDARDGTPLSGVRVGSSACCATTTTIASDEHGRVEIPGLLAGEHWLGIHATGFASSGRSLLAQPMADDEPHWRARPLRVHVREEGADFAVQLEPTVPVVVVFPKGSGMLSYFLAAREGGHLLRGTVLGGSERDFELLSGEYTLRLSGAGGVRKREPFQVEVDPCGSSFEC